MNNNTSNKIYNTKIYLGGTPESTSSFSWRERLIELLDNRIEIYDPGSSTEKRNFKSESYEKALCDYSVFCIVPDQKSKNYFQYCEAVDEMHKKPKGKTIVCILPEDSTTKNITNMVISFRKLCNLNECILVYSLEEVACILNSTLEGAYL